MLTQSEFLTIEAANWVSPFITPPVTLREVAQKVIDNFDGDFDNIPDGSRDIAWCAWLQKHWDWEKVGDIQIRTDPNGKLQGGDGNHRRVVLALMVLAGQTEYRHQPCTFEMLLPSEKKAAWIHAIHEDMKSILDREFKPIDKNTLLEMSCALPPPMPDTCIGWRKMKEWLECWHGTPDTKKRNEAYQDMNLHVNHFNTEDVRFITKHDLNYTEDYHFETPNTNDTRMLKTRMLKRHKWIAAFFIREEWKEILQVPNDLFSFLRNTETGSQYPCYPFVCEYASLKLIAQA